MVLQKNPFNVFPPNPPSSFDPSPSLPGTSATPSLFVPDSQMRSFTQESVLQFSMRSTIPDKDQHPEHDDASTPLRTATKKEQPERPLPFQASLDIFELSGTQATVASGRTATRNSAPIADASPELDSLGPSPHDQRQGRGVQMFSSEELPDQEISSSEPQAMSQAFVPSSCPSQGSLSPALTLSPLVGHMPVRLDSDTELDPETDYESMQGSALNIRNRFLEVSSYSPNLLNIGSPINTESQKSKTVNAKERENRNSIQARDSVNDPLAKQKGPMCVKKVVGPRTEFALPQSNDKSLTVPARESKEQSNLRFDPFINSQERRFDERSRRSGRGPLKVVDATWHAAPQPNMEQPPMRDNPLCDSEEASADHERDSRRSSAILPRKTLNEGMTVETGTESLVSILKLCADRTVRADRKRKYETVKESEERQGSVKKSIKNARKVHWDDRDEIVSSENEDSGDQNETGLPISLARIENGAGSTTHRNKSAQGRIRGSSTVVKLKPQKSKTDTLKTNTGFGNIDGTEKHVPCATNIDKRASEISMAEPAVNPTDEISGSLPINSSVRASGGPRKPKVIEATDDESNTLEARNPEASFAENFRSKRIPSHVGQTTDGRSSPLKNKHSEASNDEQWEHRISGRKESRAGSEPRNQRRIATPEFSSPIPERSGSSSQSSPACSPTRAPSARPPEPTPPPSALTGYCPPNSYKKGDRVWALSVDGRLYSATVKARIAVREVNRRITKYRLQFDNNAESEPCHPQDLRPLSLAKGDLVACKTLKIKKRTWSNGNVVNMTCKECHFHDQKHRLFGTHSDKCIADVACIGPHLSETVAKVAMVDVRLDQEMMKNIDQRLAEEFPQFSSSEDEESVTHVRPPLSRGLSVDMSIAEIREKLKQTSEVRPPLERQPSLLERRKAVSQARKGNEVRHNVLMSDGLKASAVKSKSKNVSMTDGSKGRAGKSKSTDDFDSVADDSTTNAVNSRSKDISMTDNSKANAGKSKSKVVRKTSCSKAEAIKARSKDDGMTDGSKGKVVKVNTKAIGTPKKKGNRVASEPTTPLEQKISCLSAPPPRRAAAIAALPGLVESPPTKKRNVTPGTFKPKLATSNIFDGCGFIVTKVDQENEEEKEKINDDEGTLHKPGILARNAVEQQLRSGGGVIFEDFTSIFAGRKRISANRSVSSAERYAATIGRIFLITSAAKKTEKYMLALALGIPRISCAWVNNCCLQNKLLEINPYALSNGWSKTLNAFCGSYNVADGVYKNMIIGLSGEREWKKSFQAILVAGNASKVLDVDALLKTHSNRIPCDIIVTASCPSVAQLAKLEGLFHARTAPEDSEMTADVVRSTPIVSKNWVHECLITQRTDHHEATRVLFW